MVLKCYGPPQTAAGTAREAALPKRLSAGSADPARSTARHRPTFESRALPHTEAKTNDGLARNFKSRLTPFPHFRGPWVSEGQTFQEQ